MGLCGGFEEGSSPIAASRIADSTCCVEYYQSQQQALEATCDCVPVISSASPCVVIVMTASLLAFGGGGNTFGEAEEVAMKECQAGKLQQEDECRLGSSNCPDKAQGVDVR